jgi:hypothetical protein
MELLIALVGGLLITVPIAAFVALIRTGTLRRIFDENSQEYRDKFTDLISQARRLRQRQPPRRIGERKLRNLSPLLLKQAFPTQSPPHSLIFLKRQFDHPLIRWQWLPRWRRSI